MIQLNKNESPFDLPELFKKEVCAELVQKKWNRYIDLNYLEVKLAEKLSVNPGNLLITSGNMDGINIFFNCIVKNKHFIQLEPSYFRYQNYVENDGLTPKKISYRSEKDFQKLLNLIIKFPFYPALICNPNNPTGISISQTKINELGLFTKSIIFVDSTYFFYTAEAFCRQYKIFVQQKNVIHAFSLSKAFSAAGVRLGFLIGNEETLKKIRMINNPFSNYFSALCLEKLLEDKWWNYGIENIKKIINNKKCLIEELSKFKNINAINTDTNFILIESINNNETEALFYFLLSHDIQTKIIGILKKIYVRITIGNNEECKRLLETMNLWSKK